MPDQRLGPERRAPGAAGAIGAVDARALGMGAVAELRDSMRGDIITATDAAYDDARRVWNGVIDRRPALIARCASIDDIIAALHFARVHGLAVCVRGGGHNVSGNAVSDGALVIDLGRMSRVRTDARRSAVRVEGGATLGDIDRETQAAGVAVPQGTISRAGIGGLSLHGGIGFLTRRYGLTSDNLVSADVVTADGNFLTVDERHYPDLFWALRGGGAGFGVVTNFEFRAHRVGPDVSFALVLFPPASASSVLRAFRDFMAGAPDEVTALASLCSAPRVERIPEQQRGRPVLMVAACHCGTVEQGARVLEPLRALGTPVADVSGTMPFLDAQRLFDAEYPDGRRYYWNSHLLPELSDATIGQIVAHAARRGSPLTSIDLMALGGAFGRVAPQATAFAGRDAAYLLAVQSSWRDPAADAVHIAWARAVHRDLQRVSTGVYLNLPGFWEDTESVLRGFYRDNYSRLRAVRAKYDPTSLFLGTVGRRA